MAYPHNGILFGNENEQAWGVPGGLGVRILGFHCCGQASVPGQGTESQAENKQEGVGR